MAAGLTKKTREHARASFWVQLPPPQALPPEPLKENLISTNERHTNLARPDLSNNILTGYLQYKAEYNLESFSMEPIGRGDETARGRRLKRSAVRSGYRPGITQQVSMMFLERLDWNGCYEDKKTRLPGQRSSVLSMKLSM